MNRQSEFFKAATGRLLRQLTALLLALGLLVSSALAADSGQSSASTQSVGKVSLVLGRAFIEKPDGERMPVKQGASISVSDRIQTEPNGHVHVHFLDQAMVSVRPDSRLEIVSYDFNQENPRLSTVKFNLEEGITRSISGKAARSARDRFRLNTPIAAIGVRGTDFVVSATENSVRALVNEGVIVLAPFSDQCSADALGPCQENAVELTHTALQLIEFDGDAAQPRLLPAPHERDSSSIRQDVQLAMANAETGADDKRVSNEVFLESTGSEFTTVASNTPGRDADSVDLGVEAPVDFTPQAPVPEQALTSGQLLWGRYSAGQGNLEKITLPYDEARIDREVAVGNRDYILFRPPLGSKNVDDGLGIVSFGLSSAQAFYHHESGVVAMRVQGGDLSIDFDRQSFLTSLDLDHALTGLVDFTAGGQIDGGGFFNSRSESQRIAGAVTLDGREAGYFFEKQLEQGGIQGLTLWNSQ